MTRRSFFDRALERAIPRPDAGYTPPPRELCDGLWALDRRLLHFGAALLPARTTILRLDDGSLVVVSPPPRVDSETVAALDAIGNVASVLVPNPFHYLFAAEFLDLYPKARLLAAPGLIERVPELGFATELGAVPPATWSGEIEVEVLRSVRGVSEVLLFHVATGSLLLTDLAFNMVRYPRRRDRFMWRLGGIPAGFGPGRTSRSVLLRDRAAASRSLSRALARPLRRIVVAHGDVVEHDARSRLREAFSAWLTEPA